MLNISGCALVKISDQLDEVEAEAKKTVEGFDTPLAIDLDSSMIGWYESLASIDFVAVIPARSDIEVGDIYLIWNDKRAEKTQDRLQRMMKRQRWERSIVPDKIAAQYRELDLVDLPFVAVSDRKSSALSDIVPSNISSENGTFSMRPTAGRVDSQPLHDILNWLEDDDSDNIGDITLKKKYWSNLSAMSVDGKQAIWLHVVSEILFIQSLDTKLSGEMSLDLPKNVEATVKTDLPTAEEAPEQSTTENKENNKKEQKQTTVQVNATEDNVITVTQEMNAFTRALAINKIMEAQGLDDNFGVKTKLMFIDDDSVVLRSTLPRPVAIGVRGLSLQVNPRTGEVLRIQAWRP
jgi:hypothetical protein